MWPWTGNHWLGSGYDKFRLLYLGAGTVRGHTHSHWVDMLSFLCYHNMWAGVYSILTLFTIHTYYYTFSPCTYMYICIQVCYNYSKLHAHIHTYIAS